MKDKSVAVLVHGCIRDFMEKTPGCFDDFSKFQDVLLAINELLKNFKTVHIYYLTWEPFSKTNLSLHEYAYNKEKLIEEFQKIPNMYKLVFDTQYTTERLDALQAPHAQQAVANNYQYPQSRTAIYNCFHASKLLCSAVKSSGNTYDYILKTRNDLLVDFVNFDEILEYADKDFLCIPPNTWCFTNPTHTNDHWVFGKSEHILNAFGNRSFDELKFIIAYSWNQEEATNTHYRITNCNLFTAPVTSYLILHGNRKFV